MARIFSVYYQSGDQTKFERAIEDGDLEKATGILCGLLPALKPIEHLERNIVMMEGYGAICKLQQEELRILRERQKSLEELDEYEGLGKIEDLTTSLKLLEEYEGLGENPEKLEEMSKKLTEYSALGSAEELREAVELYGRALKM